MLGQWCVELSGSSREGETVERLKTNLEQFEVFVREVVQNSLDAGLRKEGVLEEPVSVTFRLRELVGDDKVAFLDALEPGAYLSELQASHEYEEYRSKQRQSSRPLEKTLNQEAIDSFDRDQPDDPLRLLIVEDSGTVGLTGEDFDYGEASRFCACCRDSDFSVRESGGGARRSGGSYGKGKNVLWKHASTRLVLFHSILSESWNGESSRFIGVGKLPWHADWESKELQSRKSGRCFFGSDKDGNSILGAGSDELALQLGLHRGSDQTGTTICIVGFEPHGVYGEQSDPYRAVAREAAHVAETWYWPAIYDGRLIVKSIDESTGEEHEANPFSRDDLKPFIDAWEACEGDEQKSAEARTREITVPKGPGKEPQANAHYMVGCKLLEDDALAATNPPRRTSGPDCVALVRGFGMVVEYRRVRPRGIQAMTYSGVCRAGLAVPGAGDSGNGDGANGQRRLESLLSSAEPPAHDQWNAGEVPTHDWRGAQASVKRVLDGIQEVVSEIAAKREPSVPGETIPELSRLFRLSREEGATSRKSKLSITAAGAKSVVDGKVTFPLKIAPIDELQQAEGELILAARAELLDSGAGPVSGVRGELAVVEDVIWSRDSGQQLVVERSGRGTKTRIDITDHPFPLLLTVVVRPPTEMVGQPVHVNLVVKAGVDDDEVADG